MSRILIGSIALAMAAGGIALGTESPKGTNMPQKVACATNAPAKCASVTNVPQKVACATNAPAKCASVTNVPQKVVCATNAPAKKAVPVRAWAKFAGNPVLGNSKLGTCFDINVITNGPAPFTMYFSWRPKKCIAFVRSEDGLHWSQEPEICLPENPKNTWETIVNRSCTVFHNGEYHLWYTGQDPAKKYESKIGYAKSKDGIHFTRVSDQPVLVAEAPYEQPSVMCPSVMWDEGRGVWRMWYSAGTSYEPDCNCYAESLDGVHWVKSGRNPILVKGASDAWDRDRVAGCEVHQLPDGRYAMFYIGYSDINTARIGCAISQDGIINWKRLDQNPLVSPDLGSWDACACYKPSVFRDAKRNRWLLWYNGRNGGPEYVGCVIHEGLDLEAPIAQLPDAQALVGEYVPRFNECDEDLYKNAIPNEKAEEFLAKNVPCFACPDKDIEQIYYFRWWTYRKHLRRDMGCWTVSEFLPNVGWAGPGNMIVCPARHHALEGRWLRDSQIITDNVKFWLTDKRARRWSYSSALFTNVRDVCAVTGEDELPGKLLDDAIAFYRGWDRPEVHRMDNDTMGSDGKGSFLSLDGHEGGEISISGHGYRPLMCATMWSEAKSISEVAAALGRKDVAEEFAKKAEVNRRAFIERCWNPELNFFCTAKKDGARADVRELYGYAPWYFGMPTDGHEADWAQLFDPKGFGQKYGLSFAERRHYGFKLAYEGHECQWNGPSWPYSTSVVLGAYMNGIRGRDRRTTADANGFIALMRQYAMQHRRLAKEKGNVMLPWIDENLNPDNNDWIARTRLLTGFKQGQAKERGKDYNHSTYCDLVISGLVGFLPKGKQGFKVDPLCPATWDYFVLDNLRYRGHDVSIRWHRAHGGLTVRVDGREVARRSDLGQLDVKL